jgi:hypothetical protein
MNGGLMYHWTTHVEAAEILTLGERFQRGLSDLARAHPQVDQTRQRCDPSDRGVRNLRPGKIQDF